MEIQSRDIFKGYIYLHKNMKSWRWYKDSQTFHLFTHIIMGANYEDSYMGSQLVKRGQLVVSRDSLSRDTGISLQSIRTILTRLKSTNELTIYSTKQYSILTIVNYEYYQGGFLKPTNQPTNELTFNQPTTNQQLTISKETKEENKVKEKNEVVIPKTKIKYNSLSVLNFNTFSEEEKSYFKINTPDVNVPLMIEKLMNWCESKGKKYKDYMKALRNWCLLEQEKLNNKPKGANYVRKSLTDYVREAATEAMGGHMESGQEEPSNHNSWGGDVSEREVWPETRGLSGVGRNDVRIAK